MYVEVYYSEFINYFQIYVLFLRRYERFLYAMMRENLHSPKMFVQRFITLRSLSAILSLRCIFKYHSF